jgi:hypothetical protein
MIILGQRFLLVDGVVRSLQIEIFAVLIGKAIIPGGAAEVVKRALPHGRAADTVALLTQRHVSVAQA